MLNLAAARKTLKSDAGSELLPESVEPLSPTDVDLHPQLSHQTQSLPVPKLSTSTETCTYSVYLALTEQILLIKLL